MAVLLDVEEVTTHHQEDECEDKSDVHDVVMFRSMEGNRTPLQPFMLAPQ